MGLVCCAVLLSGDVMPRAYDEYDVSDCLKQHGWVLPAYTMAPNAKHIKLLRSVIRCARQR
jgi:glutamate decarboxylase